MGMHTGAEVKPKAEGGEGEVLEGIWAKGKGENLSKGKTGVAAGMKTSFQTGEQLAAKTFLIHHLSSSDPDLEDYSG